VQLHSSAARCGAEPLLLLFAVVMAPPSSDGDPPRGTLYIVGAFGALVVVGWLLLYFGLFLSRSTP